jgi:hypothetical protein
MPRLANSADSFRLRFQVTGPRSKALTINCFSHWCQNTCLEVRELAQRNIMKATTKSSAAILLAAAMATCFAIVLCHATPCAAQNSPIAANNVSPFSAIQQYFADWFPRVTRIQSEQPHWVTPLVTVTPRLEEEFRYDQFWQGNQKGVATDNFGGGKGLELIPFQNTEIILGVPAWIVYNGAIKHGKGAKTDGWADETFLIKYRIVSANEENGNYIVTAFMGFSAPTGNDGNSNRHGIFTPTIALGKGFGDFDVQSTAGISLPDGGLQRLGMPVAWNTALQYRIFKFFWPEFEANYTWWPNGEREGETQVYLTPGLVIRRIPIHDRVGLTLGAGYQVAVTNHPAYNHNVVFSARVSF